MKVLTLTQKTLALALTTLIAQSNLSLANSPAEQSTTSDVKERSIVTGSPTISRGEIQVKEGMLKVKAGAFKDSMDKDPGATISVDLKEQFILESSEGSATTWEGNSLKTSGIFVGPEIEAKLDFKPDTGVRELRVNAGVVNIGSKFRDTRDSKPAWTAEHRVLDGKLVVEKNARTGMDITAGKVSALFNTGAHVATKINGVNLDACAKLDPLSLSFGNIKVGEQIATRSVAVTPSAGVCAGIDLGVLGQLRSDVNASLFVTDIGNGASNPGKALILDSNVSLAQIGGSPVSINYNYEKTFSDSTKSNATDTHRLTAGAAF